MREWLKRIKLPFVIVVMVLLVLGVTVSVAVRMGVFKDKEKENGNEEIEFAFYEIKEKDLGDYDDVGAMILDCDNSSSFKTLYGGTFTSKSGKYVQGTGAVQVNSLLDVATLYAYFNEVDISEYGNGSIHISMHVSDPKYFAGSPLVVEVTSSGKCDTDEMYWLIPASVLDSGWNELYLGIKDAKVSGEPDLTKINYCRIYALGGEVGLEAVIDNIYATNTEGMSLKERPDNSVKASTKPGLLLDFDSLDGITSGGSLSLSTAKGEYQEGKGAVIVSGTKQVWLSANLNTIDLSRYKGGRLSCWVYVNDASHVKNGKIFLEISSSGTYDQNEMSWNFPGTELKTGWNEIVLSLDSGTQTKTPIDLTKVNFLRMFGLDCDESLLLIIDAVSVSPAPKRVSNDGMILDCDTVDELKINSNNAFSQTNESGEYKQGTGAFKSTGNGVVWWQIQMEELVDVSKCNGDALHMWLYVSDTEQLKGNVVVELGSGGKCDVDEYQWQVSGLKTGWNELALKFASATVSGNPDLSNINYLRVFGERKGSIMAILDDVRIVKVEKKVLAPGVILDCDSTEDMKVYGPSEGKFAVTNTTGEFKEGTGAFKSTGVGVVWWEVKLDTAIDVSEYDGNALHMWLYVKEAGEFSGNLKVELGSGGKSDVDEYQWKVTDLEDGWNELVLTFESATVSGKPDLGKINYLRVYAGKKDNVSAILDDVRIVKATEDSGDSDVNDKPTVPGMIIDCDSKENLSVSADRGIKVGLTSEEGQYKEGTGAFTSSGTGQVRWAITLTNPVDVSAYADGKLHLWLYVDDVDKWKGDFVCVTLSSGGIWDTNAGQWNYAKSNLQDGWNEIELELAEPNSSKGVIDLTTVNYFRIFQSGGASDTEMVTIIDDIRAIEKTNDGSGNDSEEDDEQKLPGVILNCDDVSGIQIASNNTWSVTSAEGEYKEGTGAFKSVGSKIEFWRILLNNPVDISAYEKGGIHVWLYVSDTTKIDDIYVEVGSDGAMSGYKETHEYQWCIPKESLTSGQWCEQFLKFDVATKSKDGGADFSKINWFRVFTLSCNGEVEVRLDDVRAIEVTEEVEQTECVLANVSSDFNGSTVATYDGTDGPGVGTMIATINHIGQFALKPNSGLVLTTPKLVKQGKYAIDDLALAFWYNNTNGETTLPGAQIELASTRTGTSQKYDDYELYFNPANVELKSGWNYIELPLSGAYIDDAFSLSELEYMRWYSGNASQEWKFQITDMKLVVIEKECVLVNVSSDFNGSTVATYEGTDGPGVGATIATINHNGQFALRPNSGLALTTPKLMKDGKYAIDDLALAFWYNNTNGETTLPGAQIELASTRTGTSQKYDDYELYFNPANVELKAGWNYIELPLSGAYIDDTFELSELEYMRWYSNNASQEWKFQITDMKLVVIEQ